MPRRSRRPIMANHVLRLAQQKPRRAAAAKPLRRRVREGKDAHRYLRNPHALAGENAGKEQSATATTIWRREIRFVNEQTALKIISISATDGTFWYSSGGAIQDGRLASTARPSTRNGGKRCDRSTRCPDKGSLRPVQQQAQVSWRGRSPGPEGGRPTCWSTRNCKAKAGRWA